MSGECHYKGIAGVRGALCSDRIVLCPDCGGSYMNFYVCYYKMLLIVSINLPIKHYGHS